MIRARFLTNGNDPRPVKWPIEHPYWVTGHVYGSRPNKSGFVPESKSVVVAYADNLDYI